MKTVYLAGPISGLDWKGATGWRDDAVQALGMWGIKGLSPMRGKDFLKDVPAYTKDCRGYADNPLSSPRGIMTRDFYDATSCDVLLVNFLGATAPSLGTAMEIAWAYQKRTPVVAIMEASGNVHDHGMINEAIGYRVDNLTHAVELIRLMLGIENPLDTYRRPPVMVMRGGDVLLAGQRGHA